MSSRLQQRTDLFKQQLLTAQRQQLIGHLETIISGYEEQIDRQQKLLDVILQPEIKVRGAAVFPADVQQTSVVKEELLPEQQEWSRSQLQDLKDSFKQQLLTAPREDLIGHFETTISRYQREIDRQQKLLVVLLQPEIKLRRADVQQLLVCKEEVLPEQQEWSPSLDQEGPHIKEEQEELWTGQEGEQLQGQEEADITKFTFTPVPVKSEDEDDEEEKPQSSQLHQRQTEQMETEANGDGCGKLESARNSHPDTHLQPVSEDGDDDDCKEARDSQSGLNSLKSTGNNSIRKGFSCSDCGKQLRNSRNLSVHMRIHTGEKPFSCSVCGKRFAHKTTLQTHFRCHTGEKPYSCSSCDKCFSVCRSLQLHMRTHTGEKPYSCSHCDRCFSRRGSLQLHMRTHTGEKPYSCSSCKKCFSQRRALQAHVRTHTGEKPYSCSLCDKCFSQRHALQAHVRTHTGEKPYSCSLCDKCFSQRHALQLHMRTHTGEKPYSCSLCDKSFSHSQVLKSHMGTHTGEKPHSCPVCNKCYTWSYMLVSHMRIHTGEKPYSCSICHKRFTWNRDIKRHKCGGESTRQTEQMQTEADGEDYRGPEPARNTHTDTNLQPDTDDSNDSDFWRETRQHQSGFTYRRNKIVFVNDRCNTSKELFVCSADVAKTEPGTNDKQTRQSHSDLNHLKLEDKKPLSSCMRHTRSEDNQTLSHTGEKPFVAEGHLTRHPTVHVGERCVVCEKTFTSESELMSHECVHESSQFRTANKSFSCSRCGEQFEHKHHLQVHMRTHAGEKLFRCSVCGKTFARREMLSLHMTCHTSEKPFHCTVCNTGFIDSESLIEHMRIHTRQTQFRCSICGQEFAWRRCLIKHIDVHVKDGLYRCSICDRGFTQAYPLYYHRCVGRPSSQPHQSPTEENRGPQTSSSAEQMKIGADAEDCGGSELARNSALNRHLDSRKPFSCSLCDKCFSRYDSLQLHMRTHTGEKPFSCSVCGKRFALRGTLQTHFRRHTGEKPHSCSLCDKRFSFISVLKSHMRSHTGEKPFSCSLCDKRFSYSSVLKSHMRTHTGEKPFSCNACDKRFTWSYQVKSHSCGGESSQLNELCTSQEGEQLQGLEEADVTKLTFAPVPVNSEDEDDEEKKPQSSQLLVRQTEQTETEADGEDCGGPEPARNSHPDTHVESDTDDSVDSDFWKENREHLSGSNSLTNDKVSETVNGCDSGKTASESLEPESDDSVDSDFWKDNRSYSCSECGQRFPQIHHLKNHMRFHSEKEQAAKEAFVCSVCGQTCLYKSHLKIHMRTHTGEKPLPLPCLL